jgi:phage shock protein A
VPTANLFERAARLAKANANQLMNSFEDPEKVLEQAVQDMQKDLVKVRQSYAEVSATAKRMKGQIQSAEAEADNWYSRAQLAIEKGEDELAREALTRRQAQQETANGLAQQVETQEALIANLYESMTQLESKMAAAKANKDQIIARARTAKAATSVNDMLAGIGTGSSVAAFERMTEKVELLEAKAEVSKELAASSTSNLLAGSSGDGTTLDAKFKALEGGASVEDELAAMKRGLALPSGKMPGALPPSGESA